MNEKKKTSNTKLPLDDLDHLESELNELSGSSSGSSSTKNIQASGFGNLFGLGNLANSFSSPAASESSESKSQIPLGQATRETNANTTTWDGFKKVDEIPKTSSFSSTTLNDREKRRKKRIMIKKLEEWAEKGTLKHGSHFTMDSSFEEVEDEYESALEEKRKKDSIKLQGWWFTTMINTLEYGNAFLNPFDLNLDGWGEQVSEDLDSYEEIFAELHEKYKGGKMAPEVSLLLRVAFSAAVVNMSNKMLSSATPGFNDVMKQSPELMKMFTNAAVETMSKQNAAFDFAKTMIQPPEETNTRFGPPPAPVETKSQGSVVRPGSMQYTQHPGNRPDLGAAHPTMFRESGVDIEKGNMLSPGATTSIPTQPPSQRPEMKGPQITPDIEQLLSGLKPKFTSASTSASAPPPLPPQTYVPQTHLPVEESIRTGNNSIVSVSSLVDLEGTALPKKTRRRHNTSNKTMALDI